MNTDTAMARDFTIKFADDLSRLIYRSADIMVPAIGVERSRAIVLAGLAGMGFKVEMESGAEHGKFLAIIEMTVEEIQRQSKARKRK